jgi:flagellar motor switch/type III secretory pathway protein FliN
MQHLNNSGTTFATEKRQEGMLTSVRFAVTIELLVAQLTLAQLRSLAPGQQLVPSIPLMPGDFILQVNGSHLGRGSLLTFDQCWALRITQLGASGASI